MTGTTTVAELRADGISRPRLVPGAYIGRFRIVAGVAAGPATSVYFAHAEGSDRGIALKALDGPRARRPGRLDRFRREIRLLAACRDPGIVPLLDAEEDGETPFYVMPWISGPTLDQEARRGRMEPRRAAGIALGIARALESIHRLGVVHRDVKPSNVVLSGRDRDRAWPILIDFGIADRMEEIRTGPPEGILGTIPYLSPEQIRAPWEVDGRSDLYALGSTLYELLTGRRPLQGHSRESSTFRILAGQVGRDCRSLRDAPAEIRAICGRLLVGDADRRYPHAADVVADLERVVGGELPVPGRGPDAVTARRALASRLLPAIAGAAAGAALSWLAYSLF